MIGDVLLALAAIALLLFATAARPQRVSCPSGWWMPEPGVCRRVAPLLDVVGPRGGWVDASAEPPGQLVIPLYCTGGARLRQAGTSAWCER